MIIESITKAPRTLMFYHWFSIFLLPPASAVAATDREIVSPDSIDGATIVDAGALIEAMVQTPEPILIDSRIPADHTEGYIEGSISLPDSDTSCQSLARRVPTTATAVLFYCNGIRCGRSARAAIIAVDCGYRNVYWFRNGMEEWHEEEYPLVQ